LRKKGTLPKDLAKAAERDFAFCAKHLFSDLLKLFINFKPFATSVPNFNPNFSQPL